MRDRSLAADAAADRSIPELLAAQVSCRGHKPAIEDATGVLSYRDLQERCLSGARLLRARWPQARVVAVLGNHGPDTIVALLTVLHAGRAVVVLDATAPAASLQELVADTEAAVLVVQQSLIPLAEAVSGGGAAPLCLATSALPASMANAAPDAEAIPPESPACILFSSGTSGRPKGVLATHRTLILAARSYAASAGLTAEDRFTLLSHPQFAAGLSAIFGALLHGATLLPFDVRARGFREMREWMLEFRPTIYHSVPTLFRAYCASLPAGTAFPSVRLIKLGGEPVHGQDLILWRRHFSPESTFVNGLGLSEANGNLCHFKFDGSLDDWPAVVPVGRPLPGVDLLILDEQGRVLPRGEVGEIAFRCPHRSPGYWRRDQWVARLMPSPDGSGEPFFRTGDLGRFLDDGNLVHLGRNDARIKWHGVRLEPAEIEAHLLAHPAVAQAVVQLQADAADHPRLLAFWVPVRGTGPEPGPGAQVVSASDLRAFLQARLPAAAIPSDWIECPSFPLTANGKLDRRALAAAAGCRVGGTRVPPESSLQCQLHALWSQVLGHADFGITDDFFVCGGNSLAALRLIAAMEQHFACELPLATIFHAPEIGLMADLLQRAHGIGDALDPCLVPLQPRGPAEPLFVIHGYGGDVFCYVDFARALAPSRPVYGLQAVGLDGRGQRHQSLEDMAEHYAGLIAQQRPEGVIHLLGQSVGGWTVWAVAAALLSRGRSLGLVAILDTGPIAAIPRRLRGSLLLRRALRRSPTYLRQLGQSKRPRNLIAFLRERQRNLAAQLQGQRLRPDRQDHFVALCRRYRPVPLPLAVVLFTSEEDPRLKRQLWRALARGGVEHRPLFEAHHHFHTPALAADLAAAVAASLERVEAGACSS